MISFKYFQYRYHSSWFSNYSNELNKQRYHEIMNIYDCHEIINIYFLLKSWRTFNHRNESMNVMIIIRYNSYLERKEFNISIAIWNWIKANPRFNSALQRDDFLIAINRDEIEDIHRNFYINIMKIYY